MLDEHIKFSTFKIKFCVIPKVMKNKVMILNLFCEYTIEMRNHINRWYRHIFFFNLVKSLLRIF